MLNWAQTGGRVKEPSTSLWTVLPNGPSPIGPRLLMDFRNLIYMYTEDTHSLISYKHGDIKRLCQFVDAKRIRWESLDNLSMLIYSTACKMIQLCAKITRNSLDNIQYWYLCRLHHYLHIKNSVQPISQRFLNTMFIISFKFLQATISVSPRSKADSNVSADLGIIHFLYPSFTTVFILLSILGTYFFFFFERGTNKSRLEQEEEEEEKIVSCARWANMVNHTISS